MQTLIAMAPDHLLQWGSETGSRRRLLGVQHAVIDVFASMGLRDWVSEKAGSGVGAGATVGRASMGLRNWVSEKAREQAAAMADQARFNGAPRLGLGEGVVAVIGGVAHAIDGASMGLRDWVSEKAAEHPV